MWYQAIPHLFFTFLPNKHKNVICISSLNKIIHITITYREVYKYIDWILIISKNETKKTGRLKPQRLIILSYQVCKHQLINTLKHCLYQKQTPVNFH